MFENGQCFHRLCVMAKPISGMKGDHADYAVKRSSYKFDLKSCSLVA